MVLTRTCDPSGLVTATVSGAVTPDDQRELVAFVQDAIARFGEVGVLIWVEHYRACRLDARFDPDGLWSGRDGKGINSIAVIGEPAWKTVAPRTPIARRVPVEYFNTERAARGWLEGRRLTPARRIESRRPAPSKTK